MSESGTFTQILRHQAARSLTGITAFVVARLIEAESQARTPEEIDLHLARCETVDRHRQEILEILNRNYCTFDGEVWPCAAMRLAAARDADHPHYRAEEWAV